jgi:Transposase, Mutator family
VEKVLVDEVASASAGADVAVLPERVQAALGELAGAAKEGLLALSVGVGLGVLHELMAEEVEDVVGPKGRHDPERVAVRHGRESGEVTLGGRRVAVERPRVRTADGSEEVQLITYRHSADRDALSRVVLERMLAGVSTRRFPRTQEPVGDAVEAEARSTSKSAVSREFVARTRENLEALMSRRLDDVRLAVLMIDGIELKGRTNVVALGIATDGVKIPLGLWEGSTENAAVATALLSDLVERGLDVEQGVLCVLDGAKALRKAVRDVLGVHTPVQRCVRHKECHEAMTSAAGSSLEGVSVPRRCRHAAVRGDRLGDAARAMVRGHAGGRGDRGGLGARRRGRPGGSGDAARARGLGVHGDDERRCVGPRAAASGRLDGADRRRAQGQGGRVAGGPRPTSSTRGCWPSWRAATLCRRCTCRREGVRYSV